MDEDESPIFDEPYDETDPPLDEAADEAALPIEVYGVDGIEGIDPANAEPGDPSEEEKEELSIEVLTSEETVKPQLNRERRTLPILTRYEKARLLGTRAVQFSQGAPPLIEVSTELDPVRLAEMELQAKRTPLILRRHLPDGSCEDWMVSELKILT
jgi:DNA-directed RNA polymerase I, II, and III subunit RPABC2